MVIQTPIEAPVGQPRSVDDAIAAQRAAGSSAQPEPVASVTEETAAASATPTPTQRAAQPLLTRTTAIVAGATLAAGIALFGIGLARRHAGPMLHRTMRRAETINVPLLFPLTIVDFAREVLSDSRETSMMARRAG